MRVAVHLPEGHPHAPDGPVVVAYKLGRVREGIDNHIIHTGETVPLDEFIDGLVKLAAADYPDATIVVERLVATSPTTSQWIPAGDFDPAIHTPAGSGESRSATFTAIAGQEAN